MNNEQAAARAREIARELGNRLYEKQLAYGNSGAIALGLWQARLQQYLVTPAMLAERARRSPPDAEYYLIPAELLCHLPRITRLDDRINRLVSNPRADRMGEDPWLDAAGDCVIGALVNEPPEEGPSFGDGYCDAVHPVFGVRCELQKGHPGKEHRQVNAGEVLRWVNHSRHRQPEQDPIEAGLPGDEP